MKLSDKFSATINDLPSVIEQILWEESVTLTDRIRKRVRVTGKNAKNDKFSNYSEKGHPRNWKGKRERAGLQIGFKDLTFSGGLFNSLSPQRSETTPESVTVFQSVKLDGRNKDGKTYETIVRKLTQQEQLGEDFITNPTERELSDTMKRIDKRVNRELKKILAK